MTEPTQRGTDDCGCCDGVEPQTPMSIDNTPGLDAVGYRVGRYPQFRSSLIAGLSAAARPALAALRTREHDDFSIATLDAFACMADVLTFYQERVVQESYLRTATERLSLREMARLIGYRPRPGVAAETYLAFTLQEGAGAPTQLILEPGIKVQSVPGPNEKPQAFETVESFEARPIWNALTLQSTRAENFEEDATSLFLQGVDTRLQPGDAIAMIDQDRFDNVASDHWQFRILQDVTPLPEQRCTRVQWHDPLVDPIPPSGEAGKERVKVFALRQRAALFGHNAPAWQSMPWSIVAAFNSTATKDTRSTWGTEWPGFTMPTNGIDLDAIYPKITRDGWLVITDATPPPDPQLRRVTSVQTRSRAQFMLNAKVTRVYLDYALTTFPLREATVYAQSEELSVAERPLPEPVFGDALCLASALPEFAPGRALALSGKRPRLKINANAVGLHLMPIDGGTAIDVHPGDIFKLLSAPLELLGDGSTQALDAVQLRSLLESSSTQMLRWRVTNIDGVVGDLSASAQLLSLIAPAIDDPVLNEIIFIDSQPGSVVVNGNQTTVQLSAALANVYDRSTVVVNANIARATHGETTHEILGGGDASQGFQSFELKQAPLTYVAAENARGVASTLEIRVNDVAWHEVPSMFEQGFNERTFTTRDREDDRSTVQFGDGVNGARLPAGRDNVRATYRKGIGVDGNVEAGRLTQLLSRPLGLKDVTNPVAASGGADLDQPSDIRSSAPLSMRTLDRVVSLTDYADFARAFGGIVKADAMILDLVEGPTVFVTVAGPGGKAFELGAATLTNLRQALRKNGDPFVRVAVGDFRPVGFRIALKIKCQPDHDRDVVFASVKDALGTAYSFDARDFRQAVHRSELIAIVQNVNGVAAVDVDRLYRGSSISLMERLVASQAVIAADGQPQGAELLTLADEPFDWLEEMP